MPRQMTGQTGNRKWNGSACRPLRILWCVNGHAGGIQLSHRIAAQGTPDQVAASGSHTGQALGKVLKRP